MKRCYFPLEIEVALAMWHEFSANKKPTFRKKGVWAAAVEYALSYLNDSYYVTQKDIANKYQVSANSISKNYDTFLNYWDIFGDTKDDPFDFPSIQSIEKRLDALRTHLEQAQPKDEEELQQILEKINEEGLPEELPVTPKSQSQNIIYDAWEIDDSNEKVRLAKKALQIYPYNADAYLILAQETAESLQEQKVLLLQGLEAGEKSLGSNFMQNNMGNFWGIVSTRSYMRVKYTLAQCLWELGEKEEALTHMRELLKLNPNDNQGVRYLLTKYLLETNKLEECKVLLEEYKEDFSAFWLYNKALLDYKMEDKHSAEIYYKMLSV